ncbi:unnamed protein product [Spirodela intermedia]|uniref:Uncharacterized protein n=1 Tax=Spirodela intermedia TaxID=51605 RepID=A0A7I8KH29_SPIIN|nr:unnamed protein product [Spirodela intermedia]
MNPPRRGSIKDTPLNAFTLAAAEAVDSWKAPVR